MVRGFSSQNVAHVDDELDPVKDIETIETELAIADLQTIDKRLPRLEKESTIDRAWFLEWSTAQRPPGGGGIGSGPESGSGDDGEERRNSPISIC